MNKLITFEGVDGCGKSTQLARAAAWLRGQGCNVVTTFEPGDTGLGAKIRTLLLSGEFTPCAEAELLLFLADRAQHVGEVIQPALASGAWVLCDRYSDSTLAYQLAARQLDDGCTSVELLKNMLSFAQCGLSPVLTLWFDVPVEEAMRRMQKRTKAGEKATRLDQEAESFHQRVAEAFHQQSRDEPKRIHRVNAALNMDDVEKQVQRVLDQQFDCITGGLA